MDAVRVRVGGVNCAAIALVRRGSERSERQRFLERVAGDEFVTGYSGIGIAKSGKRFRIENATVWQLIDTKGIYRGQAAMLPQTVDV